MENSRLNKTVHDLLAAATAQLQASDSPALDAELLLAHVLGKTRSWLRAFDDHVLDFEAATQFAALLKQRKHGTPVAHLLGKREFWSLPLEVTQDTLIPRPDTELLVQQALGHIPANQKIRVLELGTGTGAIALALASERPRADITATDKSTAALTVAKNNAQSLSIEKISFIESDWFKMLSGQCFDVIVCNPPYIAEDDPHLTQGDVRFEPRSALVAGADGLTDLRHIIAEAKSHLFANGWLLVEHGFGQAAAVQGLFSDAGFVQVSCQHDLGGQPRLTKGQLPDG